MGETSKGGQKVPTFSYKINKFWEYMYSVVTMVNSTTKLLQSCPTLCNPIDGSAPGSPVPGILQARALEWVAISFSNA